MDNKFNFRYADKKDIKTILSFIKALAKYEKMENDVVATEEILNQWLFEKNIANVLFVLEEEKEVGFVLFFYNFSTFLGRGGIYVEDLYVYPQFRGRGYGKALLKHLASKAVEEGCGRMEWSCLDWNEPSIGFYKALGAKAMDEWTGYRLEGENLKAFAGK